jgi:hypothetical protein
MSSRGKKKTTMAKLNREARLRDRRIEKQARKEARRYAAVTPPHLDVPHTDDDEVVHQPA